MAIPNREISAVRFFAVCCSWMIHPTAKVSEEVNRKYRWSDAVRSAKKRTLDESVSILLCEVVKERRVRVSLMMPRLWTHHLLQFGLTQQLLQRLNQVVYRVLRLHAVPTQSASSRQTLKWPIVKWFCRHLTNFRDKSYYLILYPTALPKVVDVLKF